MRDIRRAVVDALEHLCMLRAHVAVSGLDDQIVLDAVSLRLACAVDCVARLPAETRALAFGSDWPPMWSTRNNIVHGYLGVNPDIVRETVRHDLNDFEARVHRIAEVLGIDPSPEPGDDLP